MEERDKSFSSVWRAGSPSPSESVWGLMGRFMKGPERSVPLRKSSPKPDCHDSLIIK
jgi:hypothetical protein